MLRAYNEANEDVYIDNSIAGEKYHCPICDMPVFRKIGNGLRRPHYAHNRSEGNSSICDGWHYDMSDWHREWQERFPVECREVVVAYDGKKHRADVLIEKNKLVVEFQHSHLSPEEYAERNQFYSSAGYHVIWLFDMTDDYREGRIIYQDNSRYLLWKRPWSTFRTIIEEGVRKSGWNTDVEAVYIENDKQISKLIWYDNDNKQLNVSSLPSEEQHFVWSCYTFSLFLKAFFAEEYIEVPQCPKCKQPMIIRQFSMTRDLFWGCQNYYYDKQKKGVTTTPPCKERISFRGMLPPGVATNVKCYYCGNELSVSNRGVRCNLCGFAINYKN